MANQAGGSIMPNGNNTQSDYYDRSSGHASVTYLEARIAQLEQALTQRNYQERTVYEPLYQQGGVGGSVAFQPQFYQTLGPAAYHAGYAAATMQAAPTTTQTAAAWVPPQYQYQPSFLNTSGQFGLPQQIITPQNIVSPTAGPPQPRTDVESPASGHTVSKTEASTSEQSSALLAKGPEHPAAAAYSATHESGAGRDKPSTTGTAPSDTKAPSSTTIVSSIEDKQRSRVRLLTKRWNTKESKWEDHSDTASSGKEENVPDEAATFRRHMDADNEKKIDYEEIEIHSKPLKNLLLQIDDWWQDLVTGSNELILVETPFHPFVFEWDKYVSACEVRTGDTTATKQARNDLTELLQQLKKSEALESWLRSRETMKASGKIKFEFLWTLFPHCSKIYARTYLNELQMLEVRTCSEPGLDVGESFRVTCGAFDWDGSSYSRYNYDFYIKHFSDERPINSLEVFPAEYYSNETGHHDGSELRRRLITRGLKYSELCAGDPSTFQCHYTGAVLVSPRGLGGLDSGRLDFETHLSMLSRQRQFRDQGDIEMVSVDLAVAGKETRVILDNHAFLRSERNASRTGDTPPLGKKISVSVQSECVCSRCAKSSLQKWEPTDQPSDFTRNEERLSLLPPRLLGFALKKGIWCQFSVDRATRLDLEKSRETEPFEKELQLDEESKRLVMALVKEHESHRTALSSTTSGTVDANDFDIIEGKGQGVAIMLHGPPGVGKTLTAETIALATGRPLLTVSVAEIGVEPPAVERKLSDVFADAARWGAVLLIDEADVFVEERTKFDLKRNAMVSVLLRCLEYYDGIIIMTTNRIKSIDIAVQSRIHLAIQYHDLTQQRRIAIYENRIKRIPESEVEDRKALLESLTKSRITRQQNKANGRQIRNIVIGARALAKSEKKKLTLQHLETVDETVTTFITSMSSLTQRHKERNEAD